MVDKLVLYSGGYDSTLMLLEQLQFNDVSILYVAGRQCPNKMAAEISSIRRLLDYLRLNPLPFKVTHFHFVANPISSEALNSWTSGLTQPIQWMLGASFVRWHYDELLYGRIKGDDCSLFADEIDDFWHAMQVIISRRHYTALVSPITHLSKLDVIHKLYLEYPWALKTIFTCQLPNASKEIEGGYRKLEPCGECSSCNSERIAFRTLAVKHNIHLTRKWIIISSKLVTECNDQFKKESSFVRMIHCGDRITRRFPFHAKHDPDVIEKDEVV